MTDVPNAARTGQAAVRMTRDGGSSSIIDTEGAVRCERCRCRSILMLITVFAARHVLADDVLPAQFFCVDYWLHRGTRQLLTSSYPVTSSPRARGDCGRIARKSASTSVRHARVEHHFRQESRSVARCQPEPATFPRGLQRAGIQVSCAMSGWGSRSLARLVPTGFAKRTPPCDRNPRVQFVRRRSRLAATIASCSLVTNKRVEPWRRWTSSWRMGRCT
jgi:hypothetical protein